MRQHYPATLVELCRQWAAADSTDLALRSAILDQFVEIGLSDLAHYHFVNDDPDWCCRPGEECSLITRVLENRPYADLLAAAE